jgi:hypothetical protein
MTERVRVFDEVFEAYELVTGQSPKAGSQAFDGRTTIEVSDKVGGGLAHHRRLGIAEGDGSFKKLYERFEKAERTLDQIYFYEITRNDWPIRSQHVSQKLRGRRRILARMRSGV